MNAELKGLHSRGIQDLISFHPEVENDFGFLLQLLVGPKDAEGYESFDAMVCTPLWLINNFKKEEVIFGRHYLVVFEYNYQRIFKALKNSVEKVEGKSWNEMAQFLSRMGKWEFEDYQEYKGTDMS